MRYLANNMTLHSQEIHVVTQEKVKVLKLTQILEFTQSNSSKCLFPSLLTFSPVSSFQCKNYSVRASADIKHQVELLNSLETRCINLHCVHKIVSHASLLGTKICKARPVKVCWV